MTSIPGAQQLVSIFGYWPTFHDAEVIRFSIERHADYAQGPVVEADVYVFEITQEISPTGHYVLRHHTMATLRFIAVANLTLEGFNNQNALMGITIQDIRERQLEGLSYEVSFASSFGMSTTFLCRQAELVTVHKWNPNTRSPAA